MKRWWRYAVLRGDGIPAELDGRWLDLQFGAEVGHEAAALRSLAGPTATLEPTNRWEQREDGEVAVVYEWTRR